MTSSRDALFDLAVNRAAEAAQRLGARRSSAERPGCDDPPELRRRLEVWYLKTRFASRVPFEPLLRAVRARPPGSVHWQGGPGGGWRPGPPGRP